MKNIISILGSVILILSLYSIGGCKQKSTADSDASSLSPSITKVSKQEGTGSETTADEVAFLEKLNESLAAVSETVKPSVVNISTTTTVSLKESPFGDFFNDPFFRRFFGEDFDPHGGKRKYKTSSLGSGVIVSEDGYILTNNHVVQKVDEIKVILSDKREFIGERVGTDPQTDLAIIKIKANDLPAIKIGDSSRLKVGELVIAVGNPFALGNTITMGIVSAVGRSHVGIADYEDFIQTDAAINPGNSGGALVNIRSELVGINTAIFSTSGGNVGIGFAIPSSMAQSVMESIIKHGKVIRGWLGVSIQNVTPELREHFNIKKEKGALVADVVKGSPAEKAGIRRGDLITGFEGQTVDDTTGLRNMVSGRPPGTIATVEILREGRERSLKVTLGTLPSDMEMQKSSYDNVMKGVYVQNLTPDIRQGLDIPQNVKGVIVTNIDGDSPAADRLRRNDVIQEINKKGINSIEDYEKEISNIKAEDNVLLLVFRSKGYIYITVSP